MTLWLSLTFEEPTVCKTSLLRNQQFVNKPHSWGQKRKSSLHKSVLANTSTDKQTGTVNNKKALGTIDPTWITRMPTGTLQAFKKASVFSPDLPCMLGLFSDSYHLMSESDWGFYVDTCVDWALSPMTATSKSLPLEVTGYQWLAGVHTTGAFFVDIVVTFCGMLFCHFSFCCVGCCPTVKKDKYINIL